MPPPAGCTIVCRHCRLGTGSSRVTDVEPGPDGAVEVRAVTDREGAAGAGLPWTGEHILAGIRHDRRARAASVQVTSRQLPGNAPRLHRT